MSRQQPPLPPGPPPPFPQYMDGRDRISYQGPDSYDSYRPAVAPGRGDRYQPDSRRPDGRRDMYEFSANSYPSSSDRSASRYAPVTYDRGPPGADTYRPQEFSFRYDAPPSLNSRQFDDRRDYRPRSPPRRRNYAAENNSSFRQNGNHNRNGARGAFRGRGGPKMASDRAFLKTNREPTPELMPGMNEDTGHARYRSVEGLSDSEEAEMDMSDDGDDKDDDGQPRKKVARTDQKAADGDSVPRWSNPDPYTALPPPDESLRKKKDVVKLIRKARVDSGTTSKVEASAEDFISLDFGADDPMDQESSDDEGELVQPGVPGAPLGPRFSHRDNIQNRAPLPPPLPREDAIRPKRGPSPIEPTSDPALGNRKRNVDDEIKGPPLVHKPLKGKNPPANGKILSEWRVPAGTSGTPWIGHDNSYSANMGVWLHKEIMDFYHHVKPREFEQTIRTRLVEELRVKIKEFVNGADIQSFGSFPAGLYLPTADMDLVCLSKEFMQGRKSIRMTTSSTLFKMRDFLERSKLAIPGTVEVITKAKVPLVKYVDKLTGLKVDISFENDTGLIANRTFKAWKAQFPAMPILVTVIKHFLAMRGLNEPVNGGIGGFSVTCLVVSLLQHMPQVQSRNMIPEHHLGEILMEFFDLYGNQFNVQTTAIQLNPPALTRKELDRGAVYKNGNKIKFSIIDPNRSENDIAGGSTNTAVIIREFSKAFKDLRTRMGELQYTEDRHHQSILGTILAGNYRTFDLQREHLAHVHDRLVGPIDERVIA